MDFAQEIQTRYGMTLPEDFDQLHQDGLLDWMGGYPDPLPEGVDWKRDVYPKLHEHPPALFHTGKDLIMLSTEKILSYPIPQEWDTDTYTIVPFAKGYEGNLYALFQAPDGDDETWVAMIWEDEDEAVILARCMTDFIFRRMIEAAEIDREEIDLEYRGQDPIEAYRTDILRDMETISPYLPSEFAEMLDDLYHREAGSNIVSYYFKESHLMGYMMRTWLHFEQIGKEYKLVQSSVIQDRV
jgi:hypothetical protein